MKISVITTTCRYGIDVTYNSLRKQTLKDFEWILCDELYDERHQEVVNHVGDSLQLKHIKPRPKEEGHVWNLAHAYNDGLKIAEGELIVILDDYIWIKPNALEMWWEDYQRYGQALFTGVGNKAPYPEIKDPKGLISIFHKEYKSVPVGIIEKDNRIDGRQEVVEINHTFFELAWGACPMSIIKEIGGFDEETDVVYCGQDRNFALRIHLLLYPVYMDKRNENIGLFHQGFQPRPKDWETKHYKVNPMATRDVLEGKRNIKLNYL